MARWTAPPEALRRRWKLVAAALVALVALAALPALAETRFALVIGNGAYRNVPALANPPNDAKDIAAALKSLGFKVTLKLDLDLAAMQRSIDEFALELADADVSLFYYAGHGFQLAGRNYLIPVGAELHQPSDVASRTVALDPVLAELGEGKRKPSRLSRRLPQQPLRRQRRWAAGGRTRARRKASWILHLLRDAA